MNYVDLNGQDRAAAELANYLQSANNTSDLAKDIKNFDLYNTDENKALNAKYVSAYRGQVVIKWLPNGRSGSLGPVMLLDPDEDVINGGIQTVQHEGGHYVQYRALDPVVYYMCIGIPSFFSQAQTNKDYYSQPWEITADIYGGVNRGPGFSYHTGAILIDIFRDWLMDENCP